MYKRQELTAFAAKDAATKELARSLRAAHAKQIDELATKQSAELAKVREMAKRAMEQCERRERDATNRAERLQQELVALKQALKEAQEACAAAVGDTLGALQRLRVAKMSILAGVSALAFLKLKTNK